MSEHSTVSFKQLEDKLPMLKRYILNPQCSQLPLTDICSSYFWKSIPTVSQSFDTIAAINDNQDDKVESVLDPEEEPDVVKGT